MKISKEAKIALIAIFVLAISIWGYNFLKGKNIFVSTDEYYIVFDRVDGLIESGNVMYQGYKIGNITALEFNPEKSGKFRVKIIVQQKLKIPVNSVVSIKQVNPLASTADLEIVFSNETRYHESGDTLLSAAAKGMTDYLADYQGKFDNILLGLDSTLRAINGVLNEEGQKNLQGILSFLNASLKSIKDAMAPGGSIAGTLDNIESMSSNIAGKNGEIASAVDNFAHVSAELDSADLGNTLMKLDSTLQSVNSIMAKMDAGEGSMGKLLNDSSLYRNLDSTSYYLSQLMKDMQEHPKRYVHFSLFGRKE